MDKTWNNRAWFLVLPVLLLVAFSAIIPLMTVVNYRCRTRSATTRSSGRHRMVRGGPAFATRFMQRCAASSSSRPSSSLIEIPLGIAHRADMPRKGWGVSVCLVLMALPLLIPWNVVGTIWQIFGRADIGLLGYALNALGIDYNYTGDPFDAWVTVIADGCLALDAAGRAALLCRPASRSPTPTTRPPRSTARRAGRCSATSSCRR